MFVATLISPVIMTEVTINLSDLLNLLLVLAGSVALIALAVFLFNLAGTIKRVSKLLEDVTPSIDETVKKLPPIMDDVHIVTGNVVDITDAVVDTVPEMLDDVGVVTGSVGDIVDSVGGLVSNVADTLGSVVHLVKRPVEKMDSFANVVGTAVKVGRAYRAKQKRKAERARAKAKTKANKKRG